MLQDTEFEVWYICIKLITASDSQEIVMWLKKLAQLSDKICQECREESRFIHQYYSLLGNTGLL